MTPRFRKFALTAHVTSSVGWLGAVAAFLALAIAGLVSPDAQMVRASYLSMEMIGWFVIVPFCLASLLTGLVQSLGTEWGLFRYHWILVKFLLTILATIVLLLHMQPIGRMAGLAAETTIFGGDFRGLRIQLIADAGAAVVLLLVAVTLSVYKPWGRTSYGRRKQQEANRVSRPAPQQLSTEMIDRGGTSMAERSRPDPGDDNGLESERAPARGKPWGFYVIGAIIALVLIVVVVHLMGGGLHNH